MELGVGHDNSRSRVWSVYLDSSVYITSSTTGLVQPAVTFSIQQLLHCADNPSCIALKSRGRQPSTNMFLLSKAREIIWGKPAATKAERRLVVKIDTIILSFCCLMYWVNYLDRMNLNNAYVSGMKEDLGFHGKQLNIINTSEWPRHDQFLIFPSGLLVSDSGQSSTVVTFSARSPTTLLCRSSLHTSTSPAAWWDGDY